MGKIFIGVMMRGWKIPDGNWSRGKLSKVLPRHPVDRCLLDARVSPYLYSLVIGEEKSGAYNSGGKTGNSKDGPGGG